jgi:tetratricopeptide (TPR) repeat protein
VSETASADALGARAQALLDLDRHPEAVPLLHQALAVEPDDLWLLDLLVQAQLETEPHTALTTAHRIVELSPDGHRGHLLASFAASKAGEPKAAERHARAAVERAPNLPTAHTRLAQVLVNRKHKLREAMREAEKAIELAPDSASGYITAGNVDLRRNKKREARRFYERALEIDPTHRVAQVNLVITTKAQGQLNKAFGDVDAILRFDPHDDDARRLFDDVVFTTLVHFQWVAMLILILAAVVRVG